MKHQQEDKNLLQMAKHNVDYMIKDFTATGCTRELIFLNGKIVIPKTLQKHLVQWYHLHLCHPCETHTEQTIRQHFTWGGLSTTVK